MDKRTDQPRKLRRLLGSPNAFSFYTIFLMWALCTLFYYFGEIVDLAGWETLRWEFFWSVHDVHRLLFLAPILYAGYVFGVRASIILTIISLMTILPRALFISPYPDPLARALVFIVAAGIMGYLTATVRKETRRRTALEALLKSERDKILGILELMQDGVLIIGPDHKIRFMNASVRRDFGEGVGTCCYQLLQGRDEPCPQCRLPVVLSGEVQRWEYVFPDGRKYEVLASPYKDADGRTCQLTTFRNITGRKSTAGNPQAPPTEV